MLADRMDAIQKERREAERGCRSSVAGLVLSGAPALGEEARSGEEVAGRISRLASMAVVLHMAQAAALQRAHSDVGDEVLSADRMEVSQ